MPKNNMGVVVPQQLLADADEMVKWIGEAAQDANFTTSERTRSAVPCFAIAQEHHEGILALMRVQNYTSAYALERAAFEAYVRGVWLSICATNEQIGNFLLKEKIPNNDILVEQIEKADKVVAGLLSEYRVRRWKALCDFTHTGFRQIQRWNTEHAIEPNYPLWEIVTVLSHSEIISLMALVSFADLIENSELSAKAKDKISSMRTLSEKYDALSASPGSPQV